MSFDVRDNRILTEIYHNWRISISAIARKTHLSRRQVEYRLKQYELNDVIRTFFLVVNNTALGYNVLCYLFIQLENSNDFEKITKYMLESNNCTSCGRAQTKYDIFSNMVFRNNAELNSFCQNLKKNFRLKSVFVARPIHSEFFPLKILDNNKPITYSLVDSKPKRAIDQTDYAIIRSLSQSARKQIILVALESKISPELCLYRLRSLVENKIILGSRIQFNLKNAGFFATCIFLTIDTQKNLQKLRSFCEDNMSVNYLICTKSVTIIQVFYRNEQVLRDVLVQVHKNFPNAALETVALEDDLNVINPTPYLRSW